MGIIKVTIWVIGVIKLLTKSPLTLQVWIRYVSGWVRGHPPLDFCPYRSLDYDDLHASVMFRRSV